MMPARDDVATTAPPPRATSSGTTARGTEDDAVDVHRKHALVLLAGELGDVLFTRCDPGVQIGDVQTANLLCRVDDAGPVVHVAHVALHGYTTELRGRLLGSLAVDVDHHNGGALAGETPAAGQADP